MRFCGWYLGVAEQPEGPRVLHAAVVAGEGFLERRVRRIRTSEQRHARAELHVIGRAEHLMRGPPGDRVDRRRAGAQAIAQNRVPQVGPRFIQSADRIVLGHRAHAETGELRKDEPHPVAALGTGGQFGQRLNTQTSGATSAIGIPAEVLRKNFRSMLAFRKKTWNISCMEHKNQE